MRVENASATELIELYRRGETTPSEVVEALLGHIGRLDDSVGAFRWILETRMRADALAADRALRTGEALGPLHGVPVAVKELFDVRGADAPYGSEVFAGRVARRDAAVVQRLRSAGALIIGTTRSHEFGWGITTQHGSMGSTANPWDLARVPGGSSGGSAAALAARFCPLAIGTDTGGSIRIPAAFCGVVGVKPTHGRIPMQGGVALAPSLDHPGPMARSLIDLRLALEVMTRDDPLDPAITSHTMREGSTVSLRIGIGPDLLLAGLEPSYRATYERVVAALSDGGHRVIEVRFPEAQEMVGTFATIQMAEAHHQHASVLKTFPSERERYGPDVLSRLENGSRIALASYLDATYARGRIRHRFGEIFRSGVDALFGPVSAGAPAFRSDPDSTSHLGRTIPFRDLVMGHTVPQNLAGIPAVSFPLGVDDDGLPIGFQVSTPWGAELDALSSAATISSYGRPLGEPPLTRSVNPR